MANVPKRYPVEPNADRCGDSYATGAYVTGEIPGRDFGRQFSETVKPLYFRDNSVADPKYWPEIGLGGWEHAEVDDQIRGRIDSAYGRLDIFNHVQLVNDNAPALRWLLEHATAELDAAEDEFDSFKPALPPADGQLPIYPQSLKDRVTRRLQDALRHLRCADYWTARLKLYSEALEAYEPPPPEPRDPTAWFSARTVQPKAPLGFTAPPPAPTVLPDPNELPPPDAVGEASPSDVAQRWKVAAAIAGVVAAFFFLPRLMAINPRTQGRR